MFDTVEDLKEALEDYYIEDSYFVSYKYEDRHDVVVDQVVETGGASGGNCWGDSARHYTSDDVYDETKSRFFRFIEEHCPEISFIKFSRIKAAVCSTEDYCNREYYGNYTDYRIHVIDVAKLFEMLNDK